MFCAPAAGARVEQGGHRDAEGEEREGAGHDRDGRGAQPVGDVVADGGGVSVVGGAGDARQDGRHDGDGDDGLRHLPQQKRVVVGGDAGTGVTLLLGDGSGPGGELGDDDEPDLVGEDEEERPLGQAAWALPSPWPFQSKRRRGLKPASRR